MPRRGLFCVEDFSPRTLNGPLGAGPESANARDHRMLRVILARALQHTVA